MNTIPFHPTSTLAGSNPAEICHNLRPAPSGALTAVGLPATIASLPGAIGVEGGVYTMPDGSTCVTVYHDGALKQHVNGAISTLVEMDSPPRCVLPAEGGGLIIIPVTGLPLMATPATDGQARPTVTTLPPLSLKCLDMGTVTDSLPQITLKGTYSSTSRTLTDTDRATVDKAMREAYLRLSDRALLHGRHIQPVVARYRLIGDGGVVIHSSAPVIVGPEDGLQCTGTTLTLSGEGMRTLTARALTATEFSVGYSFSSEPDEAWRKAVRSVEILVSPQLHPLSATLPGTCSFTSATATSLTLTATLPGVNPLASPGAEGEYLHSCITSVIDNADTAMRPAPVAWTDTLAEISALRSIASMPVEAGSATGLMGVRLSAPHGFSASAVARSGDMVAWGGLRAVPFDGYTLPELSTVTSPATASEPTAVQVTMLDGSTVVSRAVMHSAGAGALSPLVVYPSPDACSMTLIADRRRVTLPLTPTPCRRWACHISPTLRPIGFTDSMPGFVMPVADPPLYDYPSAIAVARAEAPTVPVAFTAGDAGRVTAVIPALRHSSSFTVPSARFYVAGTGGLSSMALNDRGSRINLNLLYPRPVEAVTAIPSGIAFISGGRLLTLSGSRAPVELARLGEIIGVEPGTEWALGWDNSHGELWCIPRATPDDAPAGTTAVIATPDGSALYTRSCPAVVSVLSAGPRLILVDSSGNIIDPGQERSGPVSVRHVSAIPSAFRPGAEAILNIPVYGREVSGTVRLLASHAVHPGNPPRLAVMGLAINGGAINHPLVQRVRLPHSHALILDISLTASSLTIEKG
ncbi:MAG: hypothetical protein NC349_04950 [Paenibacillus sp.]|nr:hypothetical protein [Paenibacillus sp.]